MKHNVFLWTIITVEALQDHTTPTKDYNLYTTLKYARVKQTSQYTQWLYHDQS